MGIDPTKPAPGTDTDTTTELEHTTDTHADVDGPVQMLPEFGTPAVHCHDEYADTAVALTASDKAHIPMTSLLSDTGALVGDTTGVADGSTDGDTIGIVVGLTDTPAHTEVVPNRPAVVLSFVRHDA